MRQVVLSFMAPEKQTHDVTQIQCHSFVGVIVAVLDTHVLGFCTFIPFQTLPLKLTSMYHQAKMAVCCQMPLVLLVALKIRT